MIFSKKLFFSLFSSLIFSTTIIFTSFKTNLKVINFHGTSSMKEPIELIFKDHNLSNLAINIHPYGSNDGIQKIIAKKTDIGMVSYSFDNNSNQEQSSLINSNNIKSTSIAKDPILIVYKKPDLCKKDIVIKKETIEKFYSFFLGHALPDETNINANLNLISFPSKIVTVALENKDLDKNCSVILTPHVRVGGSKKSGSANAFLFNNPLFLEMKKTIDEGSNKKKKEWLKKILSSRYGTDYLTKSIPENNSLGWQEFKSNLKPGSITYLSGSLVFNNWDEIKSLNLSIAKFKASNSKIEVQKDTSQTEANNEVEINKDNFTSLISNQSYSWVKDLNILYLSRSKEKEGKNNNQKEIIEYIAKNTKKLSNLFLVPVTYFEDSNKDLKESFLVKKLSNLFENK